MNVKTTEDARKQASSAVNEAQKQARKTVRDARRQARRRLIRARVAAARMRAGNRAKASGASTRAVSAAGAVGLAAGYFLDPESGKRRRDIARDRALAVVRRGGGDHEDLDTQGREPESRGVEIST
jgi:hypothetical protein